jgi:hypothetical protein
MYNVTVNEGNNPDKQDAWLPEKFGQNRDGRGKVRRKMGREKSARTGADAAEATTRNTKTTGKSRMFRWKRNMAFLRLIKRNT